MNRMNKEQALTPAIISKLIQGRTTELARLMNLENYYNGITKITTRIMTDDTKPNNKIVNPFSKYITDTMTGYFMGKGVKYSSPQEITELLDTLEYNDEQDENSALAVDASIYGVAYEMLYIDATGQTRFKKINPKEIITIVDDTLEEELLYVIRYYLNKDIVNDEEYMTIEVYSRETITVYRAGTLASSLQFISETPHFFTLVPFVEYKNNDFNKGDFESVISLIDAYDLVASDGVNDFEAFCNSYLILKGMTATSEDIQTMKEKRVMLLDTDADAAWLTKNAAETQSQNILANTEANIHKFSHCPDMSDENFAGNASGVAMAYKTMGTEEIAGNKERKFKKGLQRRLELLAVILGLKGSTFDYKNIDITFMRNLPVNLSEDLDAILKLSGIVSKKTQLAQIPFINDVEAELEQIKQEEEEAPLFYQDLGIEETDAE